MSEEVQLALVQNMPAILAAVASILAALGALFAAWVGLRNGKAVQTVQTKLDGRLNELVETTAGMARAEGVVAGSERERSRPPVVIPAPVVLPPDRRAAGRWATPPVATVPPGATVVVPVPVNRAVAPPEPPAPPRANAL